MMRLVLALALIAGCKDSAKTETHTPAPPTPTEAPKRDSNDYCRRLDMYTPGSAQMSTAKAGSPTIPAHTFSVVARDPVTGDLGVAVQSHYFSVGSVVTWAEPGVGAIATQSFVEPAYGPKGLALMRQGVAAPDAMAKLLAEDKASDVRQLGFVDAQGHVASHTGAKCIAYAASHVGTNYAVQANIMANDKVVPAMAAAFESAKGDLADHLLATLDAAQAAGGDLRGCQSAALLIVSGNRTDTPWKDKKFDLRVDDSADPLRELRRLVVLARAYDQVNQGDLAVEKGDQKAAAEHYTAATKLHPGDPEISYWAGVALATNNNFEAAMPLLKVAFSADPAWIELTRRLVPAGLIPQPVAERVIEEAEAASR